MKRYGFFEVCGDCHEPTGVFSICSYLGYNPGTDGHLFQTRERAQEVWGCFMRELEKPYAQREGDHWTEFPFKDRVEELEWLACRVAILEVDFPELRLS